MKDEALQFLLCTQITILARQIKAEKAAKGTFTTDSCIRDSIRMVESQQPEILRRLSEILRQHS
ncbi:hypothetical protein JZS45_003297 [Salmonella enterica]|nr:hypothetical protein [Salmonella enterica]